MITLEEYARLVDARDKAQKAYWAFKKKNGYHNQELFAKSIALENQERETTRMILEGNNQPTLF